MNADDTTLNTAEKRAIVAYSLSFHTIAILSAVLLWLSGASLSLAFLAWGLSASCPAIFLAFLGALSFAGEDDAPKDTHGTARGTQDKAHISLSIAR
jgi:hypothetical protein